MRTITICGSMKFEKEMQRAAFELEARHHWNVLQCVYNSGNRELSQAEKEALAKAHKRKIEISDGIYVVDIQGYLGNSVLEEIRFAREKGKEIFFHSKEGF